MNNFWAINTEPVKMPIQGIKFDCRGTLHIPDDITPYEVAHLTVLLTFATLPNSKYGYDFDAYIKEHKLERLFK